MRPRRSKRNRLLSLLATAASFLYGLSACGFARELWYAGWDQRTVIAVAAALALPYIWLIRTIIRTERKYAAESEIPPASQPAVARRFQYSVQTLFMLLLLASVGMSWVGMRVERVRVQQAAVEAFLKTGGQCYWTYGNITTLYVTGPQVTDAAIARVRQLRHLVVLNIGSSNVTDAGMANLQGLSDLIQLWLDNTPISDAGLTHMRGLSQLQILSLSGNRITDAGLEHLCRLTRLRSLYFLNTKVTKEGVKKLRAALPDCDVRKLP
jgi:Leucine-rich repeat (LRR) protein